MTFPTTIGWPQLILFLLAIVGLGLLISAVMGQRSRRLYEDEDGRSTGYTARSLARSPRRFRLGRGLGGALLVGLALSLLWLTFTVQTYLGISSDTRVARVHASKIEGQDHTMSVALTLYDKSGKATSTKTYLVKGDEWEVQGNILKFPNWMGIFGIHSGYKLTRLEGRFDDVNMERNSTHTVVTLNGGDDNFFKTVKPQNWLSPIVEAAYGNAVIQGTGSGGDATFDVLVSQTGLYAEPVKS